MNPKNKQTQPLNYLSGTDAEVQHKHILSELKYQLSEKLVEVQQLRELINEMENIEVIINERN